MNIENCIPLRFKTFLLLFDTVNQPVYYIHKQNNETAKFTNKEFKSLVILTDLYMLGWWSSRNNGTNLIEYHIVVNDNNYNIIQKFIKKSLKILK